MKLLLATLVIALALAAAPAHSDNDGPSKEDTIDWILRELSEQTIYFTDVGGIQSGYQRVRFEEGERVLIVEKRFWNSDSKPPQWYDPDVATVDIERLIIRVEIEPYPDSTPRLREQFKRLVLTGSNNRRIYLTVRTKMADRLGKAFKHLIHISGGKKDLF